MTTLAKVRETDAGCWVGGHWGRFGSARLVYLATVHGWELSAEDDLLLDRALGEMSPSNPDARDEDWEWLHEQGGLAAQAEEWLNEHIAPEDYYFGWHDGEFYLWPLHVWHTEDPCACECTQEQIETAAAYL